jgi:hypothetical protein
VAAWGSTCRSAALVSLHHFIGRNDDLSRGGDDASLISG